MSDTEEREQAAGGQSAAGEGASPDPRPLPDSLEETEGLVVMAAAVGQLAFQMLLGNLRGEGDQGEARAAFDADSDIQPLEEKDEEQKGDEDKRPEETEAAGTGFEKCRVLDAKTGHEVGYFSYDVMAPKSLSLPTKEALPHSDKSGKEAEEGGGKEEEQEEENKTEDVDEGPQKHL